MLNTISEISKNNFICRYFDEDSINYLTKNHLPNGLKVFHLNIVSFSKHGRNLASYLKCLKFQFDIICLTEIRENNIGLIEKEFQDYEIFIDNPQKSKGGVCLLIRKNKFCNITEHDSTSQLSLDNKCDCTKCHIENKWLSLKIKNQEVIIGGIYCHPYKNIATLNCFNKALNSSLDQINRNTIAIVIGDINIDLLQEEKEYVENYITNYFNHNYIPAITIPTSISYHSAPLIDLD